MDDAADVVGARLRNHRLHPPPGPAPADEIVRWLGAVQAQDYPAAAWGIAQRGAGTAAAVDAALAAGSILRTHVLRPTWHLVAREDIRWMLALTGARVAAQAAYYQRRAGLDRATFARTNPAITAALAGGAHLTRAELRAALERGGLVLPGGPTAMNHVIMQAELDGIICSGAPRGRQQTYALLDDRAPAPAAFDREAALGELASRYFTSHGPATAPDFAWWSGLTRTDARRGIGLARGLEETSIDGVPHWSGGGAAPARRSPERPSAHLLRNYDEYTVAYAAREALVAHGALAARARARDGFIFSNVLLIDGRVAGTWRHTVTASSVRVAVTALVPVDAAHGAAIEAAAERYGRFLGLHHRLDLDAPSGGGR